MGLTAWAAPGRSQAGRGLASALALLVAALLAAGCESGGGEDSPSSAVSPAGGSPAGSAAPEGLPAASYSTSRPEMPLDYYMSLVERANAHWGDPSASAGRGNDWEVKQEESIAACMKRQGFEYRPREVTSLVDGPSDVTGTPAGSFTIEVPWLPDELADVERHGYGYWSLSEEVASGSVPQVLGEEPAEEDPNADYVASLSAQARQEYEVAMYGAAWAAYDPSTSGAGAAPEMGGCTGQAWEAHPYPAARLLAESPAMTYGGLIAQLQDQLEPDPLMDESTGQVSEFLGAARVDALNAEWLACFTDEHGEVVIPDPTALIAASPDADWDIALPASVRNPRGAWSVAQDLGADGGFWLQPGPAPEEYRSLAGRPAEVAVAVADFKCRQETDYVDRLLEIMRESQEQFVAANRAQLDEMAAALERYLAE
ncbi:MAG: hypothetical protein LBD77_10195 [Bifidobacteriaceae bacterium]|jgi:hypothetical protein|nr:hypothetical protein [Bifidobacteriaceae bacterium]